jgi:hypothetical protein
VWHYRGEAPHDVEQLLVRCAGRIADFIERMLVSKSTEMH